MRLFPQYLVLSGLVILFGCTAVPQPVPPNNKTDKEEKKEDELKPFPEITKEAEILKGLFNIYKKKEHLYWEIRPEQLTENYLLVSTVEKGVGFNFLLSGVPLDQDVLTLKRVENKIFFFKRNTFFRAQPGTPEHYAVERSFADSLLGIVKIESVNPETQGVLIDIRNLLLSDVSSISELLEKESNYSLNQSASYLSGIKNFPENIELTFRYNYSTKKAGYNQAVPDAKSLELGVHYSFSRLALGSERFYPRPADPRVGYFTVSCKDFSNPDPRTPYRHAIRRWSLEKADPQAELSAPKKPIVFWIDKATPYEYREAVKNGVLMWNKAFEQAGFKNALEVRVQPANADWDAADVRYNVILWITSHEVPFLGYGPSRTNPLTGEILDADILVEGDAFKRLGRFYKYFIESSLTGEMTPNRSLDVVPPGSGSGPDRFSCAFSQILDGEVGLALMSMMAN
ncbi:MAG: DUF5117 domain-containing protein, partial [Planctomycetota bacterium]